MILITLILGFGFFAFMLWRHERRYRRERYDADHSTLVHDSMINTTITTGRGTSR